jgi:hypothetical protein
MKTSLMRPFTTLLAIITLMAFTARLQAAPVDLLRAAYTTLSQADHDYKGHRKDAMKQIAAAAKLLGVTLAGDGKDKEKQGLSDDHLREAAGLLQQAQAGLAKKPLKHVLAAEKQIATALSIK